MARNTIAQSKVDLDQAPPFAHGQLAYANRPHRVRGYRNLDGGAAQVETVTIDTYSDGDTRTLSIVYDGETYSITHTDSTAESDASGVATAFAAEINRDPHLRRILEAEASTADIVLTGRFKGDAFTASVSVTGSAAMSTTTTTAAASPGEIEFGRVVLADGFTTNDENPKGKLAEALTTARSMVFTHSGGSANAQIVVEFEGAYYEAEGASAAALESALDSALPDGLTASVASSDVTITADTAGDTFELVAMVGAVTLKTFTAGDCIDDEIAGISCYTDLAVDNEGYAGFIPVDVCEEGDVAVTLASATRDDKLYIGTTGDDKGKIFRARAANRVYSRRLHVEEVRGGLAVVSISRR